MNLERYRRVDQVFQQALSQPPERLRSFLDESCAGDEELRKEVESLLRHEREAGNLVDPPALASSTAAVPETTKVDFIGRTLLHYRIVQKIGEGGMGVVYEAEDHKLGRRVAIKFLAESLSGDRERIARLHREAKLLASLSHPSIAAIHALEEAGGTHFLALELVEGRTLADRLKKGPLPLQEAVEVCLQIAEGLEAAHEKGIVHRDLKPGNVMLTSGGKVKILDFGLARVFREEGAGHLGLGVDTEHSPTITEAMTRPGVILGTAAYMSPEQAKGKPVDKRSDIWAFGCILYECLTGGRAFQGDTITETVAAILKSEPDWALLPADTPAIVRALLRRCLQKDPALRLHDIADARIEIGESAAEAPSAAASARRIHVIWLVAAGITIVLAGILADRFLLRHPPAPGESTIVRSIIKVEPGRRLAGMNLDPWYKLPTRTAMAVSSDGRFVVYSASDRDPGVETNPRLYLRPTDRMEAGPIPGTEGGIGPFLSPDDRWVGFWADGKLKKVPISGGVPVVLCDAARPFGASWGHDNHIVFSPYDRFGLSRISAAGGRPQPLTMPDTTKGEWSHRLPQCLPGGKGVLFTIMREWSDLHPRVALLDLNTRKWRVLMEDAADARYVASGHLVFLRQGILQAVPFDLQSFEVTGPPVPTISGVMQALAFVTLHNSAAGQFSVSDSGSLIYVSGGIVPDWENELVWVDHKGNAQPDGLPKGSILAPRLSPDGRRIAYNSMGSDYQVWIYDLNRGTATRLTQEGKSVWPNWTPDGKWVVFGWWESADINLFRQLADGSAPREEITAIEQSTTERESHLPASWSPDGSTLAFLGRNPARTRILLLDLRSHRVTPFLDTRVPESYPEFSPDGRWLAYVSDESGRSEVYVRSFPQPGGKWQISSDGGGEPLWARSGKQLFYKREDQVWVVDIRSDAGFSPGKPRLLFEMPGYGFGEPIRDWDISLDGRRFLMLKLQEMKPQPVTEMILVQNWVEELKRLCPTGRN